MDGKEGYYQREWKARAKFFAKQTDITEKRVIKSVWAPKVYRPFRKIRVTEDSKLEKLFGDLGKAHAAMDGATDAQFPQAVVGFKKMIAKAIREGGHSAVKVMEELNSKAVAKEMTPAEKKIHDRDVEKLTTLYISDLESLTDHAEAMLQIAVKSRKEDGTRDLKSAMAAQRDPKTAIKSLQATIVKGLSWLNKVDREPTIQTFNNGCLKGCRDISAQLTNCGSIFTKPKDKQVFAAVNKTFEPYGTGTRTLTEADGFETVMSESVKLRRTMTALAQWSKTAKP